MKKSHFSLTLFYIFGLTQAIFCCNSALAEKYKFNETSETYLRETIFENGDVVKSLKGDENDSFKEKLIQYKKNSKIYPLDVENDLIFIRAAFPSPKNAKIVVVSSGSSGNCCPQSLYSILYFDKDDILKLYDIGTSFSKDLSILISYTNSKLNIDVENFSDGEADKYGDLKKYSLKFVEGKGFVRTDFRSNLLKIVNVHPSVFFSDSNLREKLAVKIGYEHFKTLRSYMDVASPSKVVDGRYIVMTGMLPHSGAESNGELIVDSFTDNYWAIWVDNYTNVKIGATSKWDSRVISLAQDNYFSSEYYLSYINNKFQIKKK